MFFGGIAGAYLEDCQRTQLYAKRSSEKSKKGSTDTSQKVWYLDVLMTRTGNLETDPFFSELLRVIESEIHRQGCIFFISRCFRMTENAGRKILIRSLRRWSRMGTSAVMD